jgi:hypothetical protein
MKNLKTFAKYSAYGLMISIIMGAFVHLYGFLFDSFYAFQDLSVSTKAVLLLTIPNGMHLWIINNIERYTNHSNPYYKITFCLMANYWLGCILSFVVLCLVLLLNSFVSLPLLEHLTEDDLFGLSMLFGVPVGILIYLKLKNVNNNKP